MDANLLLKSQIVKNFGSQSNFAQVANAHMSYVSAVVRMRRTLSEARAKEWAELLKWPGDYRELFKGSLEDA